MSEDRPDSGQIALAWWRKNLRPQEETGAVRGFRARLRRAAGPVDALLEPRVHELNDALPFKPRPEVLAGLAQVLAAVETHHGTRIAKAFGEGNPKHLSQARFQRLIRTADPVELSLTLRRALPLIGDGCDVAALARDYLFWNEDARIRWCFDYYGAPPPVPADKEEDE